MHITPVTQTPAAAVAAAAPPKAAETQAAVLAARVTASTVSASILQRANGDGDGRTGTAALNDGDAAAQAAAQQVKFASHGVDLRA